MEQLELETDATLAHALSHACTVVGRKRVASKLWPELDIQSAVTRLDHCFAVERREKLSLEQIELIFSITRQHDCHIPINYLTDTLTYERAEPITPETEVQQLKREYVEATRTIAQIAKRIEQREREIKP